MTDVAVQIVPRRNAQGHPFSEVLYTVTEDDGSVTHACTRYWHPTTDSPMQHSVEAQQFLDRRRRYQ